MSETTGGASEQKQVLEMLADGKISVEDAHRLLEKLREVSAKRQQSDDKAHTPKPKYLRIETSGKEDRDRINLRIPIGMARAGLAVNSFLPSWVNRHVFVGGVDLAKILDFEGEDLERHLEELDLAVDSPNGDTVRIYCE